MHRLLTTTAAVDEHGVSMKALLLILFMVNGEPQLVDGWYPIIVDASRCEQVAEQIESQLDDAKEAIEYEVKCIPLD